MAQLGPSAGRGAIPHIPGVVQGSALREIARGEKAPVQERTRRHLVAPFYSYLDPRGALVVAVEVGSPTRELPEIRKIRRDNGIYGKHIVNSVDAPRNFVAGFRAQGLKVFARAEVLQHRERNSGGVSTPLIEQDAKQNSLNRQFIENLVAEACRSIHERLQERSEHSPHEPIQGVGCFILVRPAEQHRIMERMKRVLLGAQNRFDFSGAIERDGSRAETSAEGIGDALEIRKFVGIR